MEPKTREEIDALRNARDSFFANGEGSPLPSKLRTGFSGLRYFPIDERYQLRLRLHRHEHPEPVQIPLSKGGKKDAFRIGYFSCQLGREQIILHAYETHDGENEMHLPFRDKTSGKETYGAGRYLDLKVTPDDNYVLDFNLAYNPLCAYNEEKYDCPCHR